MCVCASASLKTDVFALLVLSFLCARISLKKGDRLERILNARRCAKSQWRGLFGAPEILFLPVYVYPSSPSLRWNISSLVIMTMDSKVRLLYVVDE